MNLSKHVGRKIKSLRESTHMTQEQLAQRMNTTNQSISRYESGARKANQDTLYELAEIFNVEIGDFFPKRNSPVGTDRPQLVPIVGSIAAGKPSYAVEDITGYLSLPPSKPVKDSYIYLEVSSDSMDKKFPVGSYVLIDTSSQVENGDVAAVKLNGEDATLKQIKFQEDGKTVILIPQSRNQNYYPVAINLEETHLSLIGKAVGMYLSM